VGGALHDGLAFLARRPNVPILSDLSLPRRLQYWRLLSYYIREISLEQRCKIATLRIFHFSIEVRVPGLLN
jgi:hypothetical protein